MGGNRRPRGTSNLRMIRGQLKYNEYGVMISTAAAQDTANDAVK